MAGESFECDVRRCFFCGSKLSSAQTTAHPTMSEPSESRPSADSDGLSALSYITPADRSWYWLLLRMKGYTLPMIAARWSVRDETVRRELKPLLDNPQKDVLRQARVKYRQQRQSARARGILWGFSFQTWWAMWRASGLYAKRGTATGEYVMARHGDEGPYCPSNVRICLSTENGQEVVRKLTPTKVQAIRKAYGTNAEVGKRFGVSGPTVSLIRNRRAWRHVQEEPHA